MKEHCNVYDLQGPMTQQDIDWMYSSNIEIYCEHPYEDGDSGWCDAATGARIIQASDRIIFHPATEEEEVFLKLKYMTELISDFL